ncbi:MAG: relaxase/mobilization nuclease domain-containing protein [Clostridiales Family XIII bacterium]|nr:relaxase/mobilization nuclease domain-containing protein [Clostridiales Family XIII bacterium]
MATTAIFPIHAGNGRSVARALKDVADYMANPFKTEDGERISSFECSPETLEAEFLLSKSRYRSLTGRRQDSDVIAYHARQSFKPGEITAEEANRLGYELAARFTKNRHAFAVYTHTDRAHIHNHLVWNSTRLDCKKKFRNFKGSTFALRRCSDLICAENGLSVVRNPKPSPGRDYARHMFGDNKPPSYRDRLRAAIDAALDRKPATFEDFLALLSAENIQSGRRGKLLRLWLPGRKQPTRIDALKGDYTEEAVRERIAGLRIVSAPAGKVSGKPYAERPTLLIDIEIKMREGKGEGYARWAKIHNLKQMAKTLIYLQENGLDDYAALKEKAAAASARFNSLSDKIKELDAKLDANATLQKHIVTYSKTRQIYVEYRKAGYSKAFRAAHEADILLHQTAKKAFDELGYGKGKKLPTVAILRAEYAPALEEKKKAYAEYRGARDEMRELLTAKTNVDRLLNITDDRRERETQREER